MKTVTSLAANPIFYLGLLVIILTVFGFQLGAYSRINDLFFHDSSSRNKIVVNTLINYGNGTSTWHNKTDVARTWNFYDLTISIARVDAISSAGVGNEHFIQAIDGVRQAGRFYWTLWLFCQKDTAWAPSPVGADLVKLTNSQALAWYYQGPSSTDPSTWQPPVAGAAKVSICSN